MFDLPYTGGGDIPDEVWLRAIRLPTAFKSEMEAAAPRFGLPRGRVPALQPNNVLAVLDDAALHVAFTHVNAGGMPRKIHRDFRGKQLFTAEQVAAAAAQHLGFDSPAATQHRAPDEPAERTRKTCDPRGAPVGTDNTRDE